MEKWRELLNGGVLNRRDHCICIRMLTLLTKQFAWRLLQGFRDFNFANSPMSQGILTVFSKKDLELICLRKRGKCLLHVLLYQLYYKYCNFLSKTQRPYLANLND